MAKGLTPKQQRFVEEYLIDLNATAAYHRAGYTAKGNAAESAASRLLRNVKVADAIAAARRRVSTNVEITRERIVEELRRIALSDVSELYTWDERKAAFVPSQNLTAEQRAVISGVESETVVSKDKDGNPRAKIKLKLKTYDKLGALDKLAKILGMYIDRVEHSGPGGGPIEMQELTDRDLVERAKTQANRLAVATAHGKGGNGNGRR